LSVEDELMRLASQREAAATGHLAALTLDPPGLLGRQIRSDLHRHVDRGRIKHTNEKVVQIETIGGGITDLVCPELTFLPAVALIFRFNSKKTGGLGT
jgi:hypothetical protein